MAFIGKLSINTASLSSTITVPAELFFKLLVGSSQNSIVVNAAMAELIQSCADYTKYVHVVKTKNEDSEDFLVYQLDNWNKLEAARELREQERVDSKEHTAQVYAYAEKLEQKLRITSGSAKKMAAELCKTARGIEQLEKLIREA